MSDTLRTNHALSSIPLDERLKRVKLLQAEILSEAQENDYVKESVYFGISRKIVDETKFTNEILELKALLQSMPFSQTLHNKFTEARRKLVDICHSEDNDIGNRIANLKELSIEEQLALASDIISQFNKLFFGDSYKYVEPTMDFYPESDRSFTKNPAYEITQTDPTPSIVQLSNNVIGTGDINVFLNLVFHEGCVHATMYQLEQSYACGWIKTSDPLYQDAKQRRTIKENGMSAAFPISSIYPNFLEEAIAFKQSAEFVSALGYSSLGIEDDIVLASSDYNWPYDHAKTPKTPTQKPAKRPAKPQPE